MARTHTDHARTAKGGGSLLSRPGVRRALPFVLVTAVALVFVLENRASIEIRLLVPVVTMPLWGALLIAWALGALACFFTMRRRAERPTGRSTRSRG